MSKQTLAALIAEAHSLAERLTTAANAASVTSLAAQPEGVREALRTSTLYFGGQAGRRAQGRHPRTIT
jgi:hypothetical protein